MRDGEAWYWFGLAFAKLIVFDSFAIVPNVETYVVAVNPKFLAFAVAAVPVAAIGYVYRDVIRHLEEQEVRAFRILLAATNGLVVWALTVETVHFFLMREERLDINQAQAILLTLTVIWALYGAALLWPWGCGRTLRLLDGAVSACWGCRWRRLCC